MTYPFGRHLNFKQYSRLVLVLFVLSVVNMSIQLPAHAAMQQKMMMQTMAPMQMSDMSHCKCPPAMCEAVASQDDKGIEKLFSNNANSLLGFYVSYSNHIGDFHHQLSTLQLFQHDWQYRQSSPPPLSLNTILHI